MTKWQYKGDGELVFPTLGIIVKNGDSFEGPDNLSAIGLVELKKTDSVKSEKVTDTETGE